MTIKFDTIFNKCQDLSSYEAGRSTVDTALYNTIRITDRDKLILRPFTTQAVIALSGMIGAVLESGDFDSETDNVVLEFSEGKTRLSNIAKSQGQVAEILTCFVMAKWLENKLVDRSQAYTAMFTDLASVFVKRAYDGTMPVKDMPNKIMEDSVEIEID